MVERSLSDVSVRGGLVGGPFGSNLVGTDYVSAGVPVIRGGNMLDGRVGGEFVFVTREKYTRDLARNNAKVGDLIFTQRGTLGQVAVIPEGEFDEYVVSQSQMRLRVDESRFDPRFVMYACKSPDFLKQVADNAISTGVPHINLGILARLTIPDIPILLQRAIGEVLGALDDKIAANDDALQLMDELVRARFEALTGELVPLSHIAFNWRKQVEPTQVNPETPYVGLEHVPRRRMWLTEADVVSGVTSAKSAFAEGDVLFGKLRPYFHKVARAPFGGVCSTDILVIRAKDPSLAGFVLAAASSDRAVRETTAASEGTRMPRTKWADLGAVEVAWPGETEARAFSQAVMEIGKLAGSLAEESRRLGRTRDELLPLLMSGRVRVRDAEKTTEEVL